ncbi:hypothetical protein BDV25DRAFT_155230 [Aspergillus avenaceus]|uniref:Uncharacterized protein n=1 Tax=Aspergillus avenaceus TaxID=36643 RepID=A0A5N6TUK9_ASPAV|nr:hypothetical protein BDV25DRAFT_155230 [Aspergillus avenaceus]
MEQSRAVPNFRLPGQMSKLRWGETRNQSRKRGCYMQDMRLSSLSLSADLSTLFLSYIFFLFSFFGPW